MNGMWRIPAAGSMVAMALGRAGTQKGSVSGGEVKSTSFDAIVIGGGVCGVSTAIHLADRGKTVLIVDRELIGADTQSSAVNSGIIESCSGLDTSLPPSHLLLSSASSSATLDDILCAGTLGMWSQLGEGVEFQRMPMLQVLESESQLSWARACGIPDINELRSASCGRGLWFRCQEDAVKKTRGVEAWRNWIVGVSPGSGLIVDANVLQDLEPGLRQGIPGAILFPTCASAHPRKVMLALKSMAIARGVIIAEETSIRALRLKPASGIWKVQGRNLKSRLSDPDEGEADLHATATHVVLACGGLSSATANLVSMEKKSKNSAMGDARTADKISRSVDLPVVPVIGAMFRTPPVGKQVLRHIICGSESEMFWDKQAKSIIPASPPCLTHKRSENGGSGWSRQMTRHLYGKQTPDGRMIWGGDRRVRCLLCFVFLISWFCSRYQGVTRARMISSLLRRNIHLKPLVVRTHFHVSMQPCWKLATSMLLRLCPLFPTFKLNTSGVG